MKKTMKIAVKNLLNFSAAIKQKSAFCNIAEGTHAGHLSCVAKADIDKAYLLVKFENGGIAPAALGERPAGVCTDSGETGDILDVALPGCAESSILCVSSSEVGIGSSLYSAANGTVSASAAAKAFKVGVALSAAPAGGIVEVDPQGFGSSAYSVVASGLHVWEGASSENAYAFGPTKERDILIASIASNAGGEQLIKAMINPNMGFEFALSKAGGLTTIISWMLIRES